MALFSSPMKLRLPRPDQALPGRETPMPVPAKHFVNGHTLTPPFPDGFAAKARGLGVRAEVLKKDFSHAEINALLGEEPTYTAAVDTFLASLDAALAARLNAHAP